MQLPQCSHGQGNCFTLTQLGLPSSTARRYASAARGCFLSEPFRASVGPAVSPKVGQHPARTTVGCGPLLHRLLQVLPRCSNIPSALTLTQQQQKQQLTTKAVDLLLQLFVLELRVGPCCILITAEIHQWKFPLFEKVIKQLFSLWHSLLSLLGRPQ